jgi:predicted CXXCH cytochrome family protein
MAGPRKNLRLWGIWGGLTLAILAFAAVTMAYGGPRHLLLIGKTTNAHHQIEMACNACHTTWFGGREAIEKTCLSCHAEDLKNSQDNHPASKFSDPRNADRLAILDVTKCLTCHVEHQPERTQAMAVTIPADFCVACHADIGDDRPTHKGLAFTTCSGAGCHNFHDNRALYEDFLEKHRNEPWLHTMSRMTSITPATMTLYEAKAKSRPVLVPDAPTGRSDAAHAMADLLATGHAKAGVNCSGCHQPPGVAPGNAATWIVKPEMAQCASCHAAEATGFTQGKHGMRLAEGMLSSHKGLFGLFSDKKLSPMRPAHARLPMKSSAHGTELGCTTCHQAHDFNLQRAKVEACLSCHNDQHTQAYLASPHHRLWQAELAGKGPAGSGVTCATCHMPRVLRRGEDGVERFIVEHNQNDNLRPNEKMARGVCMECHGLGFTLDSLADRALIDRNFKGRSSIHIKGIEWVDQRVRQRGEQP